MGPVVEKLLKYGAPADRTDALIAPLLARRRTIAKHDPLEPLSDNRHQLFGILSGWACRYVMLRNGERHIIGLMVPGDCATIRTIQFAEVDHHMMALSPLVIFQAGRATLNRLFDQDSALVEAFARAELAEKSIVQAWNVNIARRDAIGRTVHLFCELAMRLAPHGGQPLLAFDLPLTQLDLSDILGLLKVHVSRTLGQLRANRLIRLEARRLELIDFVRLAAMADFDPTYLHHDERPSPRLGLVSAP